MCILLKLNYARFGVSNLVFSKVMEENSLGGRLDSLGTGRVKLLQTELVDMLTLQLHVSFFIIYVSELVTSFSHICFCMNN